jgi:eukaryotic-like serine/threonine-protein kinase
MGALASLQIVGRYGIYGKIASGGMASVHFGRLLGAAGFSRTVAIKRLHAHLAEDPDFLATMIDEARLAARIHHPNVLPTLDVVAAEGELLVVMEYVRGESLARLLRSEIGRARRVPLHIVSAIVIGALHGLHAAHEATSDRGEPLGIVHRDVSPQNILVGIDGMARVIDFGVAKAAGRLQTTREGVVKGKMAYMAPEQLGGRETTRAVDVYGMGVVLWEMLASKRLFPGDSEGAVFGQVLAGAKDPPSHHAPDLPAALDALVLKALAPNPEDRFVSAMEMAELLLRVVPPAFPTDVGEWVREVAQEALAKRGVALAEIESSSGETSVPTSGTDPKSSIRAGRPSSKSIGDDAPTIASQPSSLSVETPRHTVALARRASLVVGAGLLFAASVAAALVWRAASPSSQATPGASAQPTVIAPLELPATEPTPSSEVPSIELSSLPATSDAESTAPHVPRARPQRPSAACDPPFYLDAKGIKHYKRECN